MADMVTAQELENAKIDARTIGESVNENKIVTPRYGAPFKSMPMIAEEMQSVIGTIIGGGVPASVVLDESGKTQQELNAFYNRNGTPYFRTIFEFMPKDVVDDVFGAKVLDHAPYFQAAIDAVGAGNTLWIPLTASAYINIGQTINFTSNHKSIKIVGSRGTASRGSSFTTFKHFGETNHNMIDVYRTWGVVFEDCSFDGLDKSSTLMTLIAERGADPAKVAHRFNFIRCGFDSAKDKLVQIGDGGNEDIAEVLFESCHFASITSVSTLTSSGIYIDAPQGYSINFNNCFLIRNENLSRMFHIRSGSVSMNGVTFEGSTGSVDIYLDPYNVALTPHITVTGAESQSGTFLETANGAGLFPDRNVVLTNVRHRADNGEVSPISIKWDLGHQSQLIMVGCNLHCVDVGANAKSVVDIANTWTRRGGSLYNVTGYTGNIDVVTGVNGYTITEASRTSIGGMRVGNNLFTVSPADANNLPKNLAGNKIDGDFWINNKSSIPKSQPAFYRFVGSTRTLMSDSVVHQTYTKTVVSNAGKFDYSFDMLAVPQANAIYEVRWNIMADRTNSIYEAGVYHFYIKRVGASYVVSKVDVSKSQQATPIITTAVGMWNGSVETATTSASQAALDTFVIRLKFNGILDGLVAGTEINISMRRIGH